MSHLWIGLVSGCATVPKSHNHAGYSSSGLRFRLYMRIMRRLTYGSEFIQSGGGLQALGNRGNRLKIDLKSAATGANACLDLVF